MEKEEGIRKKEVERIKEGGGEGGEEMEKEERQYKENERKVEGREGNPYPAVGPHVLLEIALLMG